MQKAEFINVAKSGGTALNAINRYDMFIKGKNATKEDAVSVMESERKKRDSGSMGRYRQW